MINTHTHTHCSAATPRKMLGSQQTVFGTRAAMVHVFALNSRSSMLATGIVAVELQRGTERMRARDVESSFNIRMLIIPIHQLADNVRLALVCLDLTMCVFSRGA